MPSRLARSRSISIIISGLPNSKSDFKRAIPSIFNESKYFFKRIDVSTSSLISSALTSMLMGLPVGGPIVFFSTLISAPGKFLTSFLILSRYSDVLVSLRFAKSTKLMVIFPKLGEIDLLKLSFEAPKAMLLMIDSTSWFSGPMTL